MPAAPFGNHPTFLKFIGWAHTHHGCEAAYGVSYGPDGQCFTRIKLSAPSGKFVIRMGNDHEHLTPSEIGQLVRRLDLPNPPWFMVEPEDSEL